MRTVASEAAVHAEVPGGPRGRGAVAGGAGVGVGSGPAWGT